MTDYRLEGDTPHFGEGTQIEGTADGVSAAYIVTWGPFDPGANTRTVTSRRRVKPGTKVYVGDILVYEEPGPTAHATAHEPPPPSL